MRKLCKHEHIAAKTGRKAPNNERTRTLKTARPFASIDAAINRRRVIVGSDDHEKALRVYTRTRQRASPFSFRKTERKSQTTHEAGACPCFCIQLAFSFHENASFMTVACCCGDNRRQSSWPRRVWTLDVTKPLLASNSASLSILTPAPTFSTSADFNFAEEYLCNGGWYLKKLQRNTKKHIKGNQLTWKNHKNSDQSDVILHSVRDMVKTVKFCHPEVCRVCQERIAVFEDDEGLRLRTITCWLLCVFLFWTMDHHKRLVPIVTMMCGSSALDLVNARMWNFHSNFRRRSTITKMLCSA